MTPNQYQLFASKTAVYPRNVALQYVVLGLVGEAGELANKVKKVFRDDGGAVTKNRAEELHSEIGDVLWYVAQLCTELGFDLDNVMVSNIRKLSLRESKGTLSGSGDSR